MREFYRSWKRWSGCVTLLLIAEWMPECVAQDRSTHSIEIHCIDQEGKPIVGANVFQNHVHRRGGISRTIIKNKNYTTDNDGRAKITWTGTSVDLRLWASKERFVTSHAMWSTDLQSDGDQIPEAFTFMLQTGTEIGGIVKDEAGVPIKGVKVTVVDQTAESGATVRKNQPGTRPTRSQSLSVGDEFVTDDDGRWKLKNVPRDTDLVWSSGVLATHSRFRIEIEHPEYLVAHFVDVDDTDKAPEIDKERKLRAGTLSRIVTLKSLRDGTAVFVLKGK